MRHLITTLTLLISVFLLSGCNKAEADIDYSNPEAIILDVRTVEEFNAGHLSRAKRVDWQVIQQAATQMNLDKDQPIILYCRSGNRAGKAKSMLEKMGYTQVFNLGGVADAANLTKDKIVR